MTLRPDFTKVQNATPRNFSNSTYPKKQDSKDFEVLAREKDFKTEVRHTH